MKSEKTNQIQVYIFGPISEELWNPNKEMGTHIKERGKTLIEY